MVLSVYVAGASREFERARRFIDRVRAHDRMRITHDWVADWTTQTIPEAFMSVPERRQVVSRCMDGVMRAEVLVMLAGSTETRGAWAELGAAYAWRRVAIGPREIIVSGDSTSAFASIADVIVPDDDAAFDALEAFAATWWRQ